MVLPEQTYRVTVEAHFRFLNVDYWTPVFESDEVPQLSDPRKDLWR